MTYSGHHREHVLDQLKAKSRAASPIRERIDKESDYILTLQSRYDTVMTKGKMSGFSVDTEKELSSLRERLKRHRQNLDDLLKEYERVKGKKHWLAN
ncbi:MAG: hypothetical protein WC364_14105 [Eubacteriales bacterium]|jgi:uncharacterized membrane protein